MNTVFAHYLPSHTLRQVLFDAFLLFAIMLASALLLVPLGNEHWLKIAPSALIFSVLMVGLNTALGLYRPFFDAGNRVVFARIALSLLISIPVAYGVIVLLPWAEMSLQSLHVVAVLPLVALLMVRAIVNQRSNSCLFSRRVMIIGTGEDAARVHADLNKPLMRGAYVVGFMAAGGDEGMAVDPDKILPEQSLLEAVRRYKVSEIVVGVRERRGGVLPLRELLDCKLAGVRVLDLTTFFERVQGQVRLDSLRASWLIYGDGFRQSLTRAFVKRVFDIVVASILLVLALPVMLLTMLLILLEDGAPVFYRQERVGLGGRTFRVTKFRSMRRDAEKDGKPRWATANDDRATRIGRIIRKTRIDELPQLFNVLAGDMSMVGPRPERRFFVEQLAQEVPFYNVRHCVKPGVTGWAQVRYQYGASVDDAMEKLQYDLYYVKNHTLLLDTLVLFETVRVVLTGEGAH
ncbi:MAG: TIGR03013 family PEP-CTERM/XrtA system glycosyltransferase [Thauera sp.]|jgi:sugar transferase (PEP-CTERM system associated)|nr:TIGR03013 family PEP-CTERM/XrtA system glycosyltransferase [Thauera sp.]